MKIPDEIRWLLDDLTYYLDTKDILTPEEESLLGRLKILTGVYCA